MSIIVTGATGHLGRLAVESLLKRGVPAEEIVATGRKPDKIVDLAAQSRLPGMYIASFYTDDGGLISYGAHREDLYRRAATYVDKILKGAKPADLPIERPIKFELVINLKTAKALGLTIPPTLLFQADKVIQ